MVGCWWNGSGGREARPRSPRFKVFVDPRVPPPCSSFRPPLGRRLPYLDRRRAPAKPDIARIRSKSALLGKGEALVGRLSTDRGPARGAAWFSSTRAGCQWRLRSTRSIIVTRICRVTKDSCGSKSVAEPRTLWLCTKRVQRVKIRIGRLNSRTVVERARSDQYIRGGNGYALGACATR